ncbi:MULTISPECIES: type I restriction endonuclease subunit R [Pasteurellaceae]|uniref:type I restriction endonuclease subunit R n=1 Tax=Pasteurellaceae TaxID=712 RepID=UPI0035643B86
MRLINENTIEQIALEEMQRLGWESVYGYDITPSGSLPLRAKATDVVFRDELRAAVVRLNPNLPPTAVDEAVSTVLRADLVDLAARNQQFYHFLRFGVRVVYRNAAGEQKVEPARIVDFQNVENNHFCVVNQLTIKGKKGNRRPDVIGFINGLPMVLFELKNPLTENATLTDAYQQLQTYKDEIADLFAYNQALVISDGTAARLGSLTANFDRFTPWRVVDEKQKTRIPFENELSGLVNGLMSPKNLLNYIQNFILFERTESGDLIKKIAAYHQFYGVNEAVECTLLASGECGNGKIGVMWHTQGSGKSISMLFYAAKVLAEPTLQNPTIVVVTDRNDLDGQLFATFSAGSELIRQQPMQAHSRDELRAELAKREAGGIVFTTIQKFALLDDERKHPMLNDRRNIIVISDEAHRSQYGFTEKLSLNKQNGEYQGAQGYRFGYAKHLRDALPNAAFIGFTGTPISLEDRDTQEVFGKYVSIYDIHDAVEDGATVPIVYEARQIPIEEGLDFADKVREMDAVYGDDENVMFRLREQLMGTDERLSKLAEDFVQHFEKRNELQDGKAMIVAMSREICVKLYEKITALRPSWHSDEINDGEIKIVMTGSATDPAHFQPHIHGAMDKKTLETRFKNPSDPLKVVIVRDMWLTGFDAPCCNTMYIDKPMKGHNLMQAIARVNRVFRNKSRENGGLIVDYVGIAEELKAAACEYTNANGKGEMTTDIGEIKNKVLECLDIVRGQFATPVNGQIFPLFDKLALTDEQALFRAILAAANHILSLDSLNEQHDEKDPTPRKNAFLKAVRLAKKGYSLCGYSPEMKAYHRELAFLDAVRAVIAKPEPKSGKQNGDKLLQLVALLNQAVHADGAVNLFELLNLEQPNISILSDEFLNKVKNSQQQSLWVSAIERYLAKEIRDKSNNNIALQKDFEQRLKDAINKYHNQSLSTVQVLDELIKLAKEFEARRARGEKLGLTAAEIAFYDALAKNESALREMGDEVLKQIAQTITDKLRKSATIDWQRKESVRSRMRLEVRRVLRLFKYPPDKQEEAIEFVLTQAEKIADELVEG